MPMKEILMQCQIRFNI